MKHVIAIVVFLSTTVPLRAGCGSASCPLDTNALNRLAAGTWTLDLSLQYIDQDQLRIGSRKANAGEMHGPHHDEVRTVNRIATALLSYAPAPRLDLSASMPYVSRAHDHLASSHEHHSRGIAPQHNTVPESWSLDGIGDVVLQARYAIADFDTATRSGLWLIGGVKLPTGKHDERNEEGEIAELPVQPGSGSTDAIVGLSYQGNVVRNSGGMFANVPYFVSAIYQMRTGGTDGYRLGNQLELNAGGAYPLRSVDLLLQMNARVRAKDDIGDEPEEEPFTGGSFVYVSPGLRVPVGARAAAYALVQIPVYQDVNAIQLTSDVNYVLGIQTRF